MTFPAAQSQRPHQPSAVAPGAGAGARLTVPELIHIVVTSIRNQFYLNKPARDFKRDETNLIKAVARFGYQCNANDWQFTSEEILKSIMDLLQDMKPRSEKIKYLPIYLQSTVDRHLRQKAEEYNERAKVRRSPKFLSEKIVSTVQPLDVQQPTATEILATVYTDLSKKRRAQTKKPAVKERQVSLL